MGVHIPGHEGIGTVVKLGSDVGNERALGQRVGIKWIHETCGDCEICERDSTACPNQHNSGRDRPGTLQEYVAVPAKHASPIPDGISGHLAAPLLCAGLTMFSAVNKTNTRKGDFLIITGAGGGLGHLGVQIANRRGLKVIAIDAESKRQFCIENGAKHFMPFTHPNIEDEIRKITGHGGAHAIVCCAGAETGYNQAPRLLRRGGTMVCVGLPANTAYKIPIGPFDMVVQGLRILGSSVGTEAELQELLALAEKGDILPVTHVLPLEKFEDAVEAVRTSAVPGKMVLKMG
ncbi:Polyketide synthase, enoylreductase [Penicillium occitanis (nom. inval.)]|nr:hypothetical protein PENOC_083570 [Penicillium occitanis (nom. inval.)]PCH09243.1 Polyketide synthase, enoylreductase [Penicillium occitanis (nom. inval.)]